MLEQPEFIDDVAHDLRHHEPINYRDNGDKRDPDYLLVAGARFDHVGP